MKKLNDFLTEKQKLSIDELLAIIETEESGDGFKLGDPVGHLDYPDFVAEFVCYEDGKAKVTVVAGWCGIYLPTEPVPIPIGKLKRLRHEQI